MQDVPTVPAEAEAPPSQAGSGRAALERLRRLADSRVVIEGVSPEIDCGRFPVKRVVGDSLVVEADIFCDGHEKIDAALLYRRERGKTWREEPMAFLVNDRWRAAFPLFENCRYLYTIIAWRDLYATWRDEVTKKYEAGKPIGLELIEGRLLLEKTLHESDRLGPSARRQVEKLVAALGDDRPDSERLERLMAADTAALMRRCGIRTNLTQYGRELAVFADRLAAAFSAWYELMPRSQSGDARRHGTFDDVIRRLPYVRDLGFDVLYFPPIHPIGKTNRKGKNNSLTAEEGDPGSPYAIGSEEGGHDAIHPELGTFEDFARLIEAAHGHGLEIALDFAIQCSPDHPWIREHPEWFDWRPDGSIKFAENPPKKYEDIVNVHFYRQAIPNLWLAMRDVVMFWAGRGVRIFRVDNPHTKPVPFWEWMIREVQDRYPDVIFLAEAFTKPKMMRRLAKAGFTQSYSYFTWRNTKAELTEYMTELTRSESREYMRPNFFVNTPDINPYYLQSSGRPGFQVRLFLAATLAGNYGMYNGYEICEAAAVHGKEEYLNSEKYEIRAWNFDLPGNIKPDIVFLNRLRRDNPAMRSFTDLAFYNAWNDNILYYGKRTPDLSNFLLFAVNLDPHNAQGADFEVPLWEFGLPDHAAIEAEDLVTGNRFTFHGKVHRLWLNPPERTYCVWRLIKPGGLT
jgi:starch synthase (maltosyl-transferring)